MSGNFYQPCILIADSELPNEATEWIEAVWYWDAKVAIRQNVPMCTQMMPEHTSSWYEGRSMGDEAMKDNRKTQQASGSPSLDWVERANQQSVLS